MWWVFSVYSSGHIFKLSFLTSPKREHWWLRIQFLFLLYPIKRSNVMQIFSTKITRELHSSYFDSGGILSRMPPGDPPSRRSWEILRSYVFSTDLFANSHRPSRCAEKTAKLLEAETGVGSSACNPNSKFSARFSRIAKTSLTVTVPWRKREQKEQEQPKKKSSRTRDRYPSMASVSARNTGTHQLFPRVVFNHILHKKTENLILVKSTGYD